MYSRRGIHAGVSKRVLKRNPLPDDGSAWLPIVVTSFTMDALRRHALAPQLVFLNSQTRGYHVARVSADVLQFPTARLKLAK